MNSVKLKSNNENTDQINSFSKKKYISFLWLVIGAILMIFIRGRWIIPIAAWLGPIFILRFMRQQKLRWAIPGCILAHLIAACISYQESVPLSGLAYIAGAGAMGVQFCLPFIIDRLLFSKLSGFKSTFIFPLSYTVWEYLLAQFHPYPTFGSIAYSQFGNLGLSQIVSVMGMWGLIFVVTWFSSVLNWLWEEGFDWHKIKMGVCVFISLLCLVFMYGGIRLALFSPASKTVHVTSLVRDTQIESLYTTTDRDDFNPNPSSDIDQSRETFSKILDLFLARTQKQAQAGAQIVMWCEDSVVTFHQDEDAYINRACETAKKEKIYLMMGLLVISNDFPEVYGRNETVFINPDGTIIGKYLKSYPVKGGEPVIAGNGVIPTVNTPYGKIGTATCFDMDHISFVRQAGKEGVDIFLDPSFDWVGIDPFHTNMVSFRALENGFSIIRCTADGLSASYDYQGRCISSSDSFKSGDYAMTSEIPIKRDKTVYSAIGDLFAWICIVMLAYTICYIIIKNRKSSFSKYHI